MRTETAIILALLAATSAMSAAPPEQAAVVREVRISNAGPGRVDDSFIRAHTSTAPNETLDRLAIARDVRNLLDTDRFSRVDAHIEMLDDGVRVVYTVVNRFRLGEPVVVEGAEHVRTRTIRKLLELVRIKKSRKLLEHVRTKKIRRLLELKTGDLVDDQVLGVKTLPLIEQYRKDHYPDVEVDWRIEEIDRSEGSARVTLKIREGRRARVTDVIFTGNEHVQTSTLRKAVKRPSKWTPFRWRLKRRYEPEELELARMAVLDTYVNRGFLDAEVAFPTIEKDKDGDLIVNFNIEERTQYRLGEILVEGAEVFPLLQLRQELNISSGEPASGAAIRDAQQNLTDFYGARGYLNAAVHPSLDPDETTQTVNVRFGITEGERVQIRNIRIKGNTHTRDKVIRRELLVYPGDVFNTVKVRRSERIVSNLGFFSHVRTYPLNTDAPDRKDLVVELQEQRTGQFMTGVGFSSVDKLVGFLEISQGNFDACGWPYFTGAGQKLKLSAQFGSNKKSYSLSFMEPWFMDRKLSAGFDLYRNEVSYTDYDVDRLGGAVNLGKALPGANRLDFQYRLESVKLTDIADTNRYVYADSPNEEYYFDREEDTINSSVRISLSHDTRNNPFFATSGTRVRLSGEISGGPLAFDTDIYSLGVDAVQYVPLWFDHVLCVRARYDTVEEFGDTKEVPIADRLFTGGGRTVRGFDYRDVGPKVIRPGVNTLGEETFYHRPVGGKSRAMASAEYTIPLVKPLRMAGFFDIGNAWREPYDFDTRNLASGAGLGLRLDIPGFPVRIDRAWAIEKDDEYTDEDDWLIWIGYEY